MGQVSSHPYQVGLETLCTDVIKTLRDDPQRIVDFRAIGAAPMLAARLPF
jgi:hypothetical protein